MIGSGVRTGSNTVFVAPVTVGDGAYSGAGAVIRKDVPAGALALSPWPRSATPRAGLPANRPGLAAPAEAGGGSRAEASTDCLTCHPASTEEGKQP